MQGRCPCLSYPVPFGAVLGQRSAGRLFKLFLASKPFQQKRSQMKAHYVDLTESCLVPGEDRGPASPGCLLLSLPGLSLKANPSEKPAWITRAMTPSGALAPTTLRSTKPAPDYQHEWGGGEAVLFTVALSEAPGVR